MSLLKSEMILRENKYILIQHSIKEIVDDLCKVGKSWFVIDSALIFFLEKFSEIITRNGYVFYSITQFFTCSQLPFII